MNDNKYYYLDVAEESGYRTEGQKLQLSPQLNILTGANNSGKSRFIRDVILKSEAFNSDNNIDKQIEEMLLMINQVKESKHHGTFIAFEHYIDSNPFTQTAPENFQDQVRYWTYEYLSKLEKRVQHLLSYKDLDNLADELRKISKKGLSKESKSKIENVARLLAGRILLQNPEGRVIRLLQPNGSSHINSFVFNFTNALFRRLVDLLSMASMVLDSAQKRIYVLPNRMLKTCVASNGENLKEDVFSNNFRHSFEAISLFCQVVTGQNLFEQIYKLNNGNRHDRDSIKDLENILSRLFFSDKNITLIASKNKPRHEMLIELGDDEHEIDFVGDGIKAIIILLHTLVNAPENSLIVIDEPELHLHPGLQTAFLRAILSEEEITKKNHLIFLSTHSNHFFDRAISATERIGIMQFVKHGEGEQAEFHITQRKAGELELLEELGIEPSSVFLTNCSIWCEGITDVIVIRKLLELKFQQLEGEQYQEDIHFGFVLYGGSNIAQYEFDSKISDESNQINASSMSSRILVIADKDSNKGKKHEGLSKIADQVKDFSYHSLESREIENIFGEKFILDWLIDQGLIEKGVRPKRTLSDGNYLGRWIHNNFDLSEKRNLQAESGTLKTDYKKKLARYAQKELSWDQATEEGKRLADRVCQFIQDSNNN